MPKKSPSIQLPLSPPDGGTRFRWLYDGIRNAVVDGTLAPGTRLPSTRSVACQYRLARGTVVAAFDQLVAEGYADSKTGSGTFIRHTLPPASTGAEVHAPVDSRAMLAARDRPLATTAFPKLWSNRSVETFRLDRPALDAFPVNVWGRIAARRLRSPARALLGDAGDPLGYRPLREAIAGTIALERGVKCTADEVMITGGTQHSLDLVARLMLDSKDTVWVEDPGYAASAQLLRTHCGRVVGVPVDADGMSVEAGRRQAPHARLAYTTPNCQFPLGVTMSLARRRELLQWAREADACVFEDDYDGQLRFRGRPLAALRSLDTSGRAIYSNTFNKLLFPSLRIGFLVLSSQLIEAFAAMRSITDRYQATLEQSILCDFITAGHMEQHLKRMRELYTERFDELIRSARRNLKGLMEFSPTDAGLTAVGWLAANIDEEDACRRAADLGINSVPLSRLTIDRKLPPGLILGVASSDIPAIRRGVRRLAAAVRQVQAAGRQ